MPRTRTGEDGKHMESEELVDLDGDNDPEETMEEEVEYEEVEEEEEVEEVEEEEEEEEEIEEEEENKEFADKENFSDGDEEIKGAEAKSEDEQKIHAELLALPPHGSEVYLGGIPHDASEEDLRGFCESIGEVTEVNYAVVCQVLFCMPHVKTINVIVADNSNVIVADNRLG